MESNCCLLHLGLLSQQELIQIKENISEVSCKAIYHPDIFEHIPDKIPSTISVIGDYVVQICPESQAILSGFKCDYQIQFQVMRNLTSNPRVLGNPEEIIFYFKQGQSTQEIKLKLFDQISVVNNFLRILSTKYIVQKGFRQCFKPITRIGKGMAAIVYKAENLCDHQEVAIKTFKRSVYFEQPQGKASFQKEFKILSKLKHPNLCELKSVYETQNSTYVVIELLAISLFSFVKEFGFPPIKKVKEIIKGLLEGIKQVHSLGIMHRDLKLQNIMMRKKDGKLEAVIVDFGLAEYVESQEFLYTRCGTPGYVAPEILEIKAQQKKRYGDACDIFSLGVILHILLFKKPVFEGQQIKDVIKKNTECEINFDFPQFNNLPEDGQELIKSMLKKNPKDRISAAQALEHSFLNQKGVTEQYKTFGCISEQ